MKNNHNISWFTLVELIVSITIFSIVMVSVISIFFFASQLWAKIEINRVMQENIKNVVETIAEDIRENGVTGVSLNKASANCWVFSSWVDIWDKLCTDTSQYFIATYNEVADSWIRADPVDDCQDLKNHCRLVRRNAGDIFPITNSHISFRDIRFIVSWEAVPKVTITFHTQPSVKKWVQANVIKENELYFQTTISERIIDIN